MFNEEYTAFNIVQRVVGMVSVNVKGGNYKNVIHSLQGRVEDFRIPVAALTFPRTKCNILSLRCTRVE